VDTTGAMTGYPACHLSGQCRVAPLFKIVPYDFVNPLE